MSNELDPLIGQWYVARGTNELFRVVAIDSGMIEVQTFDGDVSELDQEVWCDLDLELAAPPEDYSGPFDDLEPQDIDSESAIRRPDWRVYLEGSRPTPERWQDTLMLIDLNDAEVNRLADQCARQAEEEENV